VTDTNEALLRLAAYKVYHDKPMIININKRNYKRLIREGKIWHGVNELSGMRVINQK